MRRKGPYREYSVHQHLDQLVLLRVVRETRYLLGCLDLLFPFHNKAAFVYKRHRLVKEPKVVRVGIESVREHSTGM